MNIKATWIAFTAGALALVLGVSVAQGSISDIFGSDHDLGSTGNPTCAQCHIPHKAKGIYLWARTPYSAYAGESKVLPLCFSCHDGSVASSGQWIPSYAGHPVNPGVQGQDCDRCHDAHQGDNWMFSTDFLAGSFRNANLCGNCHYTGTYSHPTNVMTNLPVDRSWDGDLGDFSGTRLFNAAGTAVVPSGDAYIKCATCHVAHGGVLGTDLNSMAYSQAGGSHSPICENCHQ